MKNSNDFQIISELVFHAYQVPMMLITPNQCVQRVHSYNEAPAAIYPKTEEMLNSLLHTEKHEIQDMPLVKTTSLGEYFIVLHLVDEPGTYQGKWIAGPLLLEPYSKDVILSLMYDVNAPIYQYESWKYYFSQLTVMNRKKLQHLGELMYYLANRRPLDGSVMMKQQITYVAEAEENTELEKEIEQEVTMRRDHERYHHELTQEEALFSCIREGDPEKLIAVLSTSDLPSNVVLSKRSHIRSQKNLAISGITLATRAAMKGGLLPELAYTLSDVYIRRIEELKNPKEVEQLQQEALIEFTERVKNSRTSHLSKEIADCTSYIYNHLLEELTLSRLSEQVNLTPSYLSTLFKKETGISITDYIQRERIAEAKKMLKYTALPLSDICTRLNFNDQSYFTRVFKKWTGVTPLQYRKKTGIRE